MFSFNKSQPTTSGLSTSTSQPNFFGQTTATPTAGVAQPTVGGLFSLNKAPDTTSATTTGTTGGLFGSSQPATSTSGLFSFNKPADTTATATGTTAGLFGSTQPAQQTSTGGLFSFNKPVGTATPNLSGSTSFGSGLGLKPTGTTPTTTTTNPAAATTASPFGQPATTTTSGGGLFGGFSKTQKDTTTATTTGTTGLFGSTQPAQQTSTGGLFSFNKPTDTTATPNLSGSTSFGSGLGLKPTGTTPTTTATNPAAATTASPFGQPATTTTGGGGLFGGFGKPATTTTQSSLFGTTPATTTGFTGFGTGTTGTQPSTTSTGLFGTSTQPSTGSIFSLNAKPAIAPTTTGIFGTGVLGQPSTLGAPAASATQQGVQTGQMLDQEVLLSSLVNPQVFNDERDTIIAKWNQLQAFSGTGKIFYQNSAIDVPKENLFNRFKTIGYSCRPTNKNEDGLVGLAINKKEADVKADEKTITAALHKIFNSDPALSVVIDSIKSTSEDKCEVIFYLNQRVSQLTDQTNRIPSTMVFQHLNKQEVPPTGLLSGLKTTPTIKQQLEQIGVTSCYPLVGMSDDEVKSYLENVPNGLNPVLWEQARKSNPNPKKLIPVQISGFSEINKRFRLQDEESKSQRTSLGVITNSIENLNDRNKILRSKIEQFKARNEDLEQRTLKVMINYEIRRKLGMPLLENEKYLLGLLETIQLELSSPINREIQRQKLNEFADIVKSIENRKQQQDQLKKPTAPLSANSMEAAAFTDNSSFTEIQRSLKEQQKAFKSLIEMIQKDSKDLEIMRKTILNEK